MLQPHVMTWESYSRQATLVGELCTFLVISDCCRSYHGTGIMARDALS